MKKKISYLAALKFGFSSFFDNLFNYSIVGALSLMIGLVFISLASLAGISWEGISRFLMPSNILINKSSSLSYSTLRLTDANIYMVIFCLIGSILGEAYHYQMVRFGLALYDGKRLDWRNFFRFSSNSFYRFCSARMLRWLLVSIGLFFLVIPGFYWGIVYYFAGYSLVDGTSIDVKEDRIYAHKLTEGARWQILGFGIIVYFLSLGLSLTLCLGLPIVYLAVVHMYKQLQAEENPTHTQLV